MVKLLEVTDGWGGVAVSNTASQVIVNALNREDYERSDSDVTDQSRRIDDTRECMGRIVEEFYNAGFLTTDALARMAGLDPKNISEAKK